MIDTLGTDVKWTRLSTFSGNVEKEGARLPINKSEMVIADMIAATLRCQLPMGCGFIQ
jgi:hypothetical protein